MDLLQKDGAISIAGLKKNAWNVQRQVSPNYLKKSYESMPKRMEAVIQDQEGHTKY